MCNEKIFVAKTPEEYQKDFDRMIKRHEKVYKAGIPSINFGNAIVRSKTRIFNQLKNHHDIIRGEYFKQKIGE